ncbi:MAG TPA: tryptophan synthase subunit alpha [Bacteroidota bacterium]|nr:tryptophan synthase subunit alpha [Bacteroidota bacterium]
MSLETTSRIAAKLEAVRAEGQKALALFLTAGIPRLDSTVALASGLERAGMDLIEIGMPFSDPLADGPAIQQSSALALKNGVNLGRILADVREIRKRSSIPIVLMGYLNPVFAYGIERFFTDAAGVGVDGLIFPELPLEESGRFAHEFSRQKLSHIMLVAPTTPPERIQSIDASSSGFLYCVSTTGVTGASKAASQEYLARVKACAKNPVLVGFGISGPDDAREAARNTDGVIIGSALIRRILAGDPLESIYSWVGGIKEALRSDAH